MEWFDCTVGIGRLDPNVPRYAKTAADLLEEFDFCGVAEGLVFHASMQVEAVQVGNRLVLEACQGQPRLHPTWAILPFQTEELGTLPEFLEGMKRNGVKALRAYPDRHRYLLNGVTFGPLFEEMTARRIPLLLGPWWQLATDLLAEFPRLVVIITRHGDWGDDRYYRPLLERYPGFYLDTSGYQQDGAFAAHVRKYGHGRLLYGSGYPDLQMGGAIVKLAGSSLSDEAKQAIAGGNLRRLLSEVKL